MKKQHNELIKILAEDKEWQTAKTLAMKLNVSERSVKNYIAEINQLLHDPIESSKRGYRMQMEDIKAFVRQDEAAIPQSPGERQVYLMEWIITCAIREEEIDLFDVSEKLCVSIETTKKDLAVVKKSFETYGLELQTHGNAVGIYGTERKKRKAFRELIYQLFRENELEMSSIQKMIPQIDIVHLRGILMEESEKNSCYLNEYALMDILLDIAISMARIQNHCVLEEKNEVTAEYREDRYRLFTSILERIENDYAIHLDEVEENELKLMIMSLICRRRPAEQTENPKEFLDERTYLLFVRILEYLKDEFDLDDLMEDETFCYKFAGHLKNLLMRLRSGYSAKNMLTESIRESCPLTFECAIGIADIIEQEYGLQMDMSETAYLALHIGDRLESRLEKKEKISCLVIFPQYYHVANRLLEKIEKEFKDELLISFAYETLPEEKPEAELIISTVPIRGADKEQFVLISPFCNQKDILAIKERVQKIKGLRSNRKLQGRLKHVLNQKYFVKNPTFGSAEEAITYMTKRLIEDGMAAEDFTEKVLDREKQASTAFGKIALPHSLKMMGKSTGIFVIISEKPIPWHTQYVNVVLLLCISERDRMLFYDIFDNLISLFVEEKYVQEIAKCKDYTEFENLMLEYVGGK